MKRLLVLMLSMVAVSTVGQSSALWQGARPCVILDGTDAPVIESRFEYFAQTGTKGKSSIWIARWYGRWEGAYFHAVGMGDIDLAVWTDYRHLQRSGGESLPDRTAGVGALALDAGWTWRYINDTALQLRMRPGLYTDFSRLSLRGLYAPVALTGIWRVSDTLSAKAGVDMRLGYQDLWVPLAGIAWEPSDWLRMDLMVPESRLAVRWSPVWRSHLVLGRWSDSYAQTSGLSQSPHRVTFKDYRVTSGVTRMINEELSITFDLGWSYDRRIRFDGGSGSDRNVYADDTLYMGISLAGPF